MLISVKHIIFSAGIIAVIGLMLAIIFIIAKYKPVKEKDDKKIISPKDTKNKTYIDLKTLSQLWKKKKQNNTQQPVEINIEELSQIWRSNEDKTISSIKKPKFVNSVIADFYNNHIHKKPFFKKQLVHQAICVSLLTILDKEGNCPSVVDKNKIPADFESRWDNSTYNILKRITLTQHTLNVCKNIIETLSKDNSKSIIPNALIAGLGHDIGKIESLQGEHYSLGDHPLTAGVLLLRIEGFKTLPKKDDIINAVKLHHKQPNGIIGRILKEADMKARQSELEEIAQIEPTKPEPKTDNIAVITSEPVKQPEKKITQKPSSEPIAKQESSGWNAQKDIYDIGDNKANTKKEPVKRVDISSWFDPDGFIEEMKPYINKLFGTRWMAISMSNGYVYFQSKVLEEIARKQAKAAGDLVIPAIPAGNDDMRPILLSVVDCFRTEGKIAKELIKDNFFGGYFSVLLNSGKIMKGYYTPFHAETFGKIGDMEAEKPQKLQNIKSIEVFDE